MLQRDADHALKARAARVVPNGMYGHEAVHILPAGYPQYFARAKGAHLWDADGAAVDTAGDYRAAIFASPL